MANEDSRKDSVVGGALKLAATGVMLYGGYRGGRSLIKHYDNLGGRFSQLGLGESMTKFGNSMSEGIQKGISKFDSAEGNKVRKAFDNVQNKILEKDYIKSTDKMEKKILNAVDLEFNGDFKDQAHKSFLNLGRDQKREVLHQRNINTNSTIISAAQSGQSVKDYINNTPQQRQFMDASVRQGFYQPKGTNARNASNA